MRRSVQSLVLALSCSVLLAACGGGGGGSDDPKPALTFNPKSLSVTYPAGFSAPIHLTANVTNPDDFSGGGMLIVVIEDPDQVLTSQVELNPVSEKLVEVTLHTSTAKPAGQYTGTLNVHLCKDASCSSEYPGSPIPLHYNFTAT